MRLRKTELQGAKFFGRRPITAHSGIRSLPQRGFLEIHPVVSLDSRKIRPKSRLVKSPVDTKHAIVPQAQQLAGFTIKPGGPGRTGEASGGGQGVLGLRPASGGIVGAAGGSGQQ